jgi:hypothetical protein
MVCGLAVAVVTLLQGDRDPHFTSSSTTSEGTPGTAALRATIDPETGSLVQGHQPTLKADPELQEILSRSTEGLVPVQHPDGSVSVNLQGRFQSASMARIDSTGKLHTTCVDTPQAAEAACRHEPVAKDQGEER